MSKKPKVSPPPAAPQPQNEYYYEGDKLKSQRVYDKSLNGYVTKSILTPDEQSIQNQGDQFIQSLFNDVPGLLNPQNMEAQRKAFVDPQVRALEQSYRDTLGNAENGAASTGTLNSIGFENYKANQLDKNLAQGKADIEANAELQKYDLPRRQLAPYMDAYNLLSGALNGEQASVNQNLNPSFTGSQAASNFAASNYGNQLQGWKTNNALQSQSRGGGVGRFFSTFYDPLNIFRTR